MKNNRFRLTRFAVFVIIFGGLVVAGSFILKGSFSSLSTANIAEALPLQVVQKDEFKKESESREIEILFVGDMNFDRYIRWLTNRGGSDFIFSCIDPILKEVDFVVGNLEGPITENASVSIGSAIGSPENYRFTFATSTAETLARHNIKVVNIGNNHIGDFGLSGIESTRKYLGNAGVGYFGGKDNNSSIYRMSQQGINLSFVSYNQFGGESVEKVLKSINEEHLAGNRVIVYTHWGEEYVEATKHEKDTAALFVKSGADIVIGSHPHVVQSFDRIENVPVYYSLGNFIFDQYFDEAVRSGLAVRVRISKEGLLSEEIPLYINKDGTTCKVEE